MNPARVMVAMSGGVDSSVTAALLLERGYDVTGVTLKLWSGGESGCCTAADAADAKAVARRLGIAHYVLDYEEEFRKNVVDAAVSAYLSGATPNPCIECNRVIKFRLLLDRAHHLGCEYLATGHHARISHPEDGIARLRKGADPGKDQSYFLYMLGQHELGSMMLPIGEMTKVEVRADAMRLGLRTATKDESQDICFAGGGMRGFLEREAGDALIAGEIVDAEGRVIGSHGGAALFTVGQRRGVAAPVGRRVYVTGVDTERGIVRVGEYGDLNAGHIEAFDASWIGGVAPTPGMPVDVKIRYGALASPGRIVSADEATFAVELDEPAWAPAPGQAMVCYSGDEVLGGGTIARWSRS